MPHLPAKVDCDSDVLGHDMGEERHSFEGIVAQNKGSTKHSAVLGEGDSFEFPFKVL